MKQFIFYESKRAILIKWFYFNLFSLMILGILSEKSDLVETFKWKISLGTVTVMTMYSLFKCVFPKKIIQVLNGTVVLKSVFLSKVQSLNLQKIERIDFAIAQGAVTEGRWEGGSMLLFGDHYRIKMRIWTEESGVKTHYDLLINYVAGGWLSVIDKIHSIPQLRGKVNLSDREGLEADAKIFNRWELLFQPVFFVLYILVTYAIWN